MRRGRTQTGVWDTPPPSGPGRPRAATLRRERLGSELPVGSRTSNPLGDERAEGTGERRQRLSSSFAATLADLGDISIPTAKPSSHDDETLETGVVAAIENFETVRRVWRAPGPRHREHAPRAPLAPRADQVLAWRHCTELSLAPPCWLFALHCA